MGESNCANWPAKEGEKDPLIFALGLAHQGLAAAKGEKGKKGSFFPPFFSS